MSQTSADILIVGGGILGLSVAMQLSKKAPGQKILLLEKESELAFHQTGHNSGVIHSGIYYSPNSLKAQFSRRGSDQLLQFCQERGIPVQACGKIILASQDHEIPMLQELLRRGQANGVKPIHQISPEEIREIEPEATGKLGLHLPQVSIVDFRQVAQACAETFLKEGGQIETSCQVQSITRSGQQFQLRTNQGERSANWIINCAGLHADRLAALPQEARIIPFRGEYFRLSPDAGNKIRGLIYPVPDPRYPFLGVHLTRTIDGSVEAGPNAILALSREGYHWTDVRLKDCWEMMTYGGFWKMASRHAGTGIQEMARSFSKTLFLRSLQRLVPSLQAKDLIAPGSGVRAQAVDTQGQLLDDFKIQSSEGALHLLNAPSPAATASLAIGEEVTRLALKQFSL